jgi:hypothetical protein
MGLTPERIKYLRDWVNYFAYQFGQMADKVRDVQKLPPEAEVHLGLFDVQVAKDLLGVLDEYANLDAANARIAELESPLRALVEAEGAGTVYDMEHATTCSYCHAMDVLQWPAHRDDCPVLRARRLLGLPDRVGYEANRIELDEEDSDQ